MDFIVSEKSSTHGLLLVITDADIVGKSFEEDKLQLDLSIDFYKGEIKSKEEIKELVPKARHIHLTGKEAVAIGIELNLVDVNIILYVQGIPHAEAFIEN